MNPIENDLKVNDNLMQTYSISPDSLVQNSNSNDLICCICLNICFEPIFLDCCQKLLCLNCLENLIKNNQNSLKCPYCNNKKFTFNLPNKLINRFFEALLFKCPLCNENIQYKFYHEHLYNTCKNRIKGKYFCKKCHLIYYSNSPNLNDNEIPEHNCKSYINTLINFSNNSILMNKINKLKLKILEIELPKEIIREEEDGSFLIKEIHIHPLILTNERINPGYQQGWVCELCNDEIRNPLQKSYHCESCLFDLCEKCFNYIKTRIPNNKCHNHELNLEIRNEAWKCNICNNIYYKRRSWYCDICDFDVCVFCYWKEP